jgi:hypothetical protein
MFTFDVPKTSHDPHGKKLFCLVYNIQNYQYKSYSGRYLQEIGLCVSLFVQIRVLFNASHCVTYRNILCLRSILSYQSPVPDVHMLNLLLYDDVVT